VKKVKQFKKKKEGDMTVNKLGWRLRATKRLDKANRIGVTWRPRRNKEVAVNRREGLDRIAIGKTFGGKKS